MEPESPVQPSLRRTASSLDLGLLTVAIVSVSFGAILARWSDAPALVLSFWRTMGGGLLLLPGTLRTAMAPPGVGPPGRGTENLPRDADRTRTLRWMAIGGIALAVHFWSWLASLERTSVAVSVTLVTTTPFFVAIAERLGGRRLTRRSQAALVIAFLGVTILSFSASDTGGATGSSTQVAGHISGVVLALIGAVAMAVYLVVGARLRSTMPATVSTAPVFLIAGSGLFVASRVVEVDVFDLTPKDWVLVAMMVLGPQLAGHAILNHLLGTIGAMTIAIALLAEPVVSTILAWLLLSERPADLAIVGAAVVLIGLALRLFDPQARISRAAANRS